MAFAAAGVLVVVAATVGLMWLVEEEGCVRPPPEVKRLTFDSGLALHPAVSPDGKYLAFASDRAGEGNLDIWVQALPGGEPVRLTKDAADEDFPSFSPDGHEDRIPDRNATDGQYTPSRFWEESRDCWPRRATSRDTRPMDNGSRLRFPITGSGQETLTTAVFLMPAEGGERTEFRTGFLSSSNPVWSPDASQLLYAGFRILSASERSISARRRCRWAVRLGTSPQSQGDSRFALSHPRSLPASFRHFLFPWHG